MEEVYAAALAKHRQDEEDARVRVVYSPAHLAHDIVTETVMGAVIQSAAVPLDGYMTGFTINAVVMVVSGLLGLALLWPNTERARLMAGQEAQPKFA